MITLKYTIPLVLTIGMMACSARTVQPTAMAVVALATPTIVVTPTVAPTTTPITPTATPEPEPEPLPLLPAMMLGPVTTTIKSPTNQYEATIVNNAGELSTSFLLTIDQAQRNGKWTVLKTKQAVAGGVVALVPLGWSSDEQYFYFTRMYAGAGCDAFLSGSEISQANVLTRKVRTTKYKTAGPMALSPDAKTLAQVVYEEVKPARTTRRKATATPTPSADEASGPVVNTKLVLRDVGGRRERSIMLLEGNVITGFQAGSLTWKPDGSALMLAYAYNPCNANARYSVVEIDVKTLKPRVVIEQDAHLFTPQVWAEGGWVELLDRQQKRWLMDPTNGQVAQVGS